MTALPRVTVVIPSNGRWHFLRRALRTVALQDGVEADVIVVVDGPAIEETEEIESLRGPGVQVLCLTEPSISRARNHGLEHASGEWLALLDDDDLWAPEKLARQVAAAEAAGAGFAYSSATVVDATLAVRWAEAAPDPAGLPRLLAENNPIPACASNLLVRRDALGTLRFDEGLRHFADWDFAARLILAAPGARCPETHVAYVWHDGAMHIAALPGIEGELLRFEAMHAREGRKMGGLSQSRWLAGSYRQQGHRLQAARAYLDGARRYRSPADAARAVGVLFGERAMARASWTPPRKVGATPAWLALYR